MTALLALPAQNNFGDTVPDGVAGPLGLFITVLLVVATVLLIRNMNSRLRRLPESFPVPGSQPEDPARSQPDGTARAESGGATDVNRVTSSEAGPEAPASRS